MKRAIILGLSVAAMTFAVNVETASADHCRSRIGRGYSGYRYSSPYRYGYRNLRYRSPYYGSYYRNRGNFGYYGRRGRFRGGSGIYIQGRNFGFGLRY